MLRYEDRGHGPAVVLLHGFPLSRRIWAGQIDHLSRRYRVVAPDLPGLGESEPLPDSEPPTMLAMARRVLELLDYLKIDRAAVAGHSMGGYVSLALQKEAPHRVAGLALVCSQARSDAPEARQARFVLAERVMQEGAQVAADALAPRLFGPRVTERSEVYQETLALMRASRPEGVRAALLAMADRENMRPHLVTITVPSLVLAGEADAIIPLERAECMAANMANAILVKVPGAGHMPMLEAPEAVSEALDWWLELVY